MPMKIASLNPWTVTLFLRDVGDSARTLDRARGGDWSGVAKACDQWEFCETGFQMHAFAIRIAASARFYAAAGGTYCHRLSAYYRAIALAAFAGARGSRA